jgi:uncharacterized protein YcbK (DUF882 family)
MNLRRRQCLQFGAALACAGAGQLLAHNALCEPDVPAAAPPRHLTLRNLHTAEVLDIDYSSGGIYVPDAMARIMQVLRDYRTGEQHEIDPALLDGLCDLAAALHADPVFDVISGYRSPQTNELLRSQSAGVALHSLHMDGRAIDVRLAGVDCGDLAAAALKLARGGVGYYRRSDFVHLDTGAVRSWQG